jgi:hemolysin activation/secretion protein
MLNAAPANAQAGGTPEPLPLAPPQPQSPPAVMTPPPAARPPAPAVSAGVRFPLRDVRVIGSTVLTDADIEGIKRPFIGMQVGANELEEIRRRLTEAYVQRGYITSGAVLPDQAITEGIITYQIVEGNGLSRVDVLGTSGFSPDYFRRRFELVAGSPLDINELNRQTQVVLQAQGLAIRQLSVDLQPDETPGQAHLTVNVVEGKRWIVTASVANDAPPTIGPIRGQIGGTVFNLLGWGDVLNVNYGRTEALNNGSAFWSIPITPSDTMLSFRYDNNDAIVIDDIFRSLDITSLTETFGVALEQPLYRTGDQNFSIGMALDYRSNETTLLGRPFNLSPGSIDGQINAVVLRFSQNWLRRSREDVIALRSTFSIGLPVLDATNLPLKPNANFQAWLGQFQYVRQIFGNNLFVFRLSTQLAITPLFSFEQIAIGGANTVRGYRENELVRDNAVIASLEDHVPIAQLSLFGRTGAIELVPFFDYGNAWNTGRPTPSPNAIMSAGLGVRFALDTLLQMKLDYGYALRPIEHPDYNLQDSGLHFRIATQY